MRDVIEAQGEPIEVEGYEIRPTPWWRWAIRLYFVGAYVAGIPVIVIELLKP